MLSPKPWNVENLVRLLLGVMVCLCFFVLAQGGLEHFLGKNNFAEGTFLYLLFNSLSLHGSILLVTALFLWRRRVTWSEAFGLNATPFGYAIFWGALVALLFYPVGIVLQDLCVRVLTWSHVPTPPQTAVDEFNKAVSQGGRAYLALFAIFIAPAAEEILFRGILYPAIKQLGFPRLALWFNVIVWSAIHHSLAIFVPLIVLGLALTWLYERTNNLLASITAHSVFNAVGVALIYFGDYLDQFFEQHFHR